MMGLEAKVAAVFFLLFSSTAAQAQVPEGPQLRFNVATPDGRALGEMIMTDTPYGVYVQPRLRDLPLGHHRIELHQNPNCSNSGPIVRPTGSLPRLTGERDTSGDVLNFRPTLTVDESGEGATAFMMPHGFRLRDLVNRSLVIVQENGSDGLLACGVTPNRIGPRG